MAIARRLLARGHEVQIVCASAVSPPADLDIVVLGGRAQTNHGRNRSFSRALGRHVAESFNVVVGFDALEGLDTLYCANPPVRLRGFFDSLLPRKRTLLKLERACFGSDSDTHLLMLSSAQRADYERRWALNSARVSMVPPTIERGRVVPQQDRAAVRARIRAELGLPENAFVWLFVAGYPKTKGFDRVLAAMPECPPAHLLCIGAEDKALTPFRAQAKQLGVASRVSCLGPRDDVPELMVASDILVHPARLDITGTVILEAVANGLPVIASEVCGYAPHLKAAEAGEVLGEPFAQAGLNAALQKADSATRGRWRQAAESYAATTDLFSGLDVATEAIIAAGEELSSPGIRPLQMRR